MQGGARTQGWGWAVRWGCWLGGARGCEWYGLTILVAWAGWVAWVTWGGFTIWLWQQRPM